MRGERESGEREMAKTQQKTKLFERERTRPSETEKERSGKKREESRIRGECRRYFAVAATGGGDDDEGKYSLTHSILQ